jgi:hypothetical protein
MVDAFTFHPARHARVELGSFATLRATGTTSVWGVVADVDTR